MIIFLGNDSARKVYDPLIKLSKGDKDIVVSCQYPYLIPESLINTHTCVNIHYGLLPEFAGCNPIYWQLMKSDRAGVTLHYVDKNFDSGDIISTYSIPLSNNMLAEDLYKELEKVGFNLLKQFYSKIINGDAPRTKQDLSFRKYYNKKDVNFDAPCRSTKELNAKYFPSKQYPKIIFDGDIYEVRRT